MLLHCPVAVGQQTDKLQENEQALKQAIDNKDNGKAAFYSYEIAKQYEEQNQPDKAIDYLSQGVTYAKKAGDDMLGYLAYQRVGQLYTDVKNYSKALDSFQKALKLAQGLKKDEFVSEGLVHVAESYAQLNRYKKSIEPLEEALSLALQQNDRPVQERCYELLAEYHRKLGNTAKAREYENLSNTLIQNQQKQELSEQQLTELKQQINEAGKEKKTVHSQLTRQTQKLRRAEDSLLATRYSLEETERSLLETKAISEKRQLEIDLLNKDKELAGVRIKEQNARLENEALIRNSIITGVLLAAALVSVVVTGYRRKLKANKKIDEQNKSIKSSINYAMRIQHAMLPKPEQQKELVPDSFVLFKPRDSVSGDFYWFSQIKNWYNPDVVFAAVDCTGHGIPGAFMSMIGINALNGIVSRGIADSDQMLHALDEEVRTALQQATTGNNDGMDIALCIYRKEKSILEFSGAKSPLVYVQNKELSYIKGDIHSIGGSRSKHEFRFKKHLVTIDQPTMVYLFSDGYRDQFGGEEGTKFMSKRFNKLLLDIHHLPLEEQLQILDKTIEEWKGTHNQTDDILVMGIRLDATLLG